MVREAYSCYKPPIMVKDGFFTCIAPCNFMVSPCLFFLHVLHHVMLWFLRAFVRYPLFFIHNVYHTSMKLAILKMSNLMLLLIHEP
jgi:hypothetical protein